MISVSKKQIAVAISILSFGTASQAALTVNGQNANYLQQQAYQNQANQTITYPNQTYQSQNLAPVAKSSSLDEARRIMYGNDTSSSTNTIYYHNNESSHDTAKSFQNYTHNYSEIPNSYNSNNNSAYNSYNTFNNNNTFNNSSFNNSYASFGNNDFNKLPINTKSRGAMVIDLVSGETIYQKNANVSRPIASISKIMTAMVVLDAQQDMNQMLFVKNIDTQKRSNYEKPTNRNSVSVGDGLNRAEWLLIMLMKSENRAAKVLARNYPGGYSAFIKAMNAKAQSLGMYDSHFGDPSGLDKRNVASPNDLVKMVKAAGNYDIIRNFSTRKSHTFHMVNYSKGDWNNRSVSTNSFVRNNSYPISLQKTGYIRDSGKSMVMETRINNRPAIVVLLGASSYERRNKDVNTILASLSTRY